MPRIKPESKRAVVRSYSMPRWMLEEAEARAEAMGYLSFSDYIRHLVRMDIETQSPHVREAPAEYEVKPITSESQAARNQRREQKLQEPADPKPSKKKSSGNPKD